MTFELATQLAEVGFPFSNNCEYRMFVSNETGPIYRYVPTLSELIEACGVAFSELSKMTHTKQPARWTAVSDSCEECNTRMTIQHGTTPEEAVAKLWLELNKPL